MSGSANGGHPSTPPLEAVVNIVAALRSRGAEACIGGSGLLASLGLVDHVRDWDVTTDAPDALVIDAIEAVELGFIDCTASDELFASRRRLVVDGGDHSIDVIVGFALRVDGRAVRLPARTSGYWRGLPMADPTVWQQAYSLLGRHDEARRLSRWLEQQPAGSPLLGPV